MSAPEFAAGQFVVDSDGNRVAVVLPIAAYEELIELVEQYYDLIAVAEAETDTGGNVEVGEFLRRVERERGWRTA